MSKALENNAINVIVVECPECGGGSQIPAIVRANENETSPCPLCKGHGTIELSDDMDEDRIAASNGA